MRTALVFAIMITLIMAAGTVQAEKPGDAHPDYSKGALNCTNAIPVTCGAVVTGNNTGFPANVQYYSCGTWSEIGSEVVYRLDLAGPDCHAITAALSGMSADLDIYILGSCEETDCLAYGDATATTGCLEPGTYYVVVDGYGSTAPGAQSAYTLSVSCAVCSCPSPCPPVQHTIPFYEDFERSDCFPPEGWTIYNLGDNPAGLTWEWGNYNYCSGAGTARCYWGGTSEYQDEWFITPMLNTAGMSEIQVSFQHKSTTWAYCTHPKNLLVSTTGYTIDSFFDVWTYVCADPIPNCQTVTVTIGAPYLPADHVYIAWRYQGVWAESYNVDNIAITGQVTPVEAKSWGTIKAMYR